MYSGPAESIRITVQGCNTPGVLHAAILKMRYDNTHRYHNTKITNTKWQLALQIFKKFKAQKRFTRTKSLSFVWQHTWNAWNRIKQHGGQESSEWPSYVGFTRHAIVSSLLHFTICHVITQVRRIAFKQRSIHDLAGILWNMAETVALLWTPHCWYACWYVHSEYLAFEITANFGVQHMVFICGWPFRIAMRMVFEYHRLSGLHISNVRLIFQRITS